MRKIVNRISKEFFPYISASFFIRDIKIFYERGLNGGRKSIRYEEIDKTYKIGSTPGAPVHYLEQLQMDLTFRD